MIKLLIACTMLLFYGCQKNYVIIPQEKIKTVYAYNTFTILQGQHYADKNGLRPFAENHLNFTVKFDSSAIYQTVDPVNQYDINKLYGFSEGGDHHINSARIGWAWNRGSLRLYAYVYSDSIRIMKEITTVAIGNEIACSIGIADTRYVFSIDETTVSLERAIKGPAIEGYRLYPYFGGDETAPHNIFIYIKETKD